MVTCRKIRDILLTEAADGQMSGRKRQSVQDHLARCQACRAFQAEVYAAAVQPFNDAPRQDVPKDMLNHIWDTIESREAEAGSFMDVLRGWEQRLFSRPSLALMSMVFLFFIIVSGVGIRSEKYLSAARSRGSADEEYIAYMTEYFGEGPTDDVSGYGTLMEYVFYN